MKTAAGRSCFLCSALLRSARASRVYRDVATDPFVIVRIGRMRDPVAVSREHRVALRPSALAAALAALKEAGSRLHGNRYYIKETTADGHWSATAKRLRVSS